MKINDAFNPSNPVNIEFLHFTNNSGVKFDLKNFFVEFDIYTSLFATIEARVLILDTNDIVSKFPIMGGEKIRLRFSTSGRKDKTTLDFVVSSLGERIQNDKMKAIWLELETADRYEDVKLKSSRGYNDSYSVIFNQIMKEFGTTRDIESDNSVGIQSVATPRWSPLKVCRWIANRALDDQEMPFAFYEDFGGYKFKSFTNILTGEVQDKFFQQNPGLGEDDYKKFRNIQDMWIESKFDSVGFNALGLNKSKEVSFNFLTKQMEIAEKSYTEHFDKMPSLEKHPLRVDDGDFETELIRFNQVDNSHKSEYNRMLMKYLFQQYSLNITVFGDNEIVLGGVYTFNVPESGPIINGERKSESYTSGKFLAVAIKHVLRPDDYRMNAKLVKDSLSSKLPEKQG